MNDTETRDIEAAMDREDWAAAQRLIARALQASPDDHWLIGQMSAALYEQRHYAEALTWARKALALAPHCPGALWDYAGALDMTRHERQAIKIWQKLLDRGVGDIADGECGEGKRWAESLLNDCRYRIGHAYLDLGEHAKAVRYLREHFGTPTAGTAEPVYAGRRTQGAAQR